MQRMGGKFDLSKVYYLNRLFLSLVLYVFHAAAMGQTPALQLLGNRLRGGDRTALYQLAGLLDNQRAAIYRLGEHRIETTESALARNLLHESLTYADAGFTLPDSAAGEAVLSLLRTHDSLIGFSEEARIFLILPLETRPAQMDLRILPRETASRLQWKVPLLLKGGWAFETGVSTLLRAHDPRVLPLVASLLFRTTQGKEFFGPGETELADLLRYLLGAEVGAPDSEGKWIWFIGNDYDQATNLNLLAWLTQHASGFKWNDALHRFEHPDYPVRSLNEPEALLQNLYTGTEQEAYAGFRRLAEWDTTQLAILLEPTIHPLSGHARVYPSTSSWQRILATAAKFSAYCRSRNVAYHLSPDLEAVCGLLRQPLPLAQRRLLEDSLQSTLTFDKVTALEYQSLLELRGSLLDFSVARVADRFYSSHWQELVADTAQLDLYLLKSVLFSELRVIGAGGNYWCKFRDADSTLRSRLLSYASEDPRIRSAAREIVRKLDETLIMLPGAPAEPEPLLVADLQKKMRAVKRSDLPQSEKDDALSDTLEHISFDQIGDALRFVARYRAEEFSDKYWFMRYWGLLPEIEWERRSARDSFLAVYTTHSPSGLYAYYLDQANVDYKGPDGELDFDKIYDHLEYGVGVPLFGLQSLHAEAFSLVKLLEYRFGTTLGYSPRFFQKRGEAGERLNRWRSYLRNKGLLRRSHERPPSFLVE